MRTQRAITPSEALDRLAEACSRDEHCSGELRRKLALWGIGAADAVAIIAKLTEARYVDDARFARAYVREKVQLGYWGRRKVRLALMQKRVPAGLIDEALEQIEPEAYLESLRHVLAAKRRTLSEPDSYEGRTRLFRYAVSRGFEPDLIASELRRR